MSGECKLDESICHLREQVSFERADALRTRDGERTSDRARFLHFSCSLRVRKTYVTKPYNWPGPDRGGSKVVDFETV